MTTLNLQLTNFCSGGGHADLTVTGDATHSERIGVDDLLSKIQEIDIETAFAALIRIALITRTPAQVKALLQAGVTVNL